MPRFEIQSGLPGRIEAGDHPSFLWKPAVMLLWALALAAMPSWCRAADLATVLGDLPASLLQIGPSERLRDLSYMKKLLGPDAEWPPYGTTAEGRMYMGGRAHLRYTIGSQRVSVYYTYDMRGDTDGQQKAYFAVFRVNFEGRTCYRLKDADEEHFTPDFGPNYAASFILKNLRLETHASSGVKLELGIQPSPERCIRWILLISGKTSN